MPDPISGADALNNLLLQSQNKKLLNELEKQLDNNDYSEDVLPEKILSFFWKKKVTSPQQIKSLLDQLSKGYHLWLKKSAIEELSKAISVLIQHGIPRRKCLK